MFATFRKISFLALIVGLVTGLAFLTVAQDKDTLTVFSAQSGHEAEAIQDSVSGFEAATGIDVKFTFSRDLASLLNTRVRAGNPPDVAILPNPGQMKTFAERGDLESISFMKDTIQRDHRSTWVDLGSVDGTLYGFYVGVSNKSMVWYNPQIFEEAGYEPPENWDELMELTEAIAEEQDIKPWSIGLESDAASGWPGTDWIEDIMLRTAGPELYDKWVNHEISWTHPAVKQAWELFGEIAKDPDYVYGGTSYELTTNFGDAILEPFKENPNAFMHKQASFASGFITDRYPDAEAGKDYDFFSFPEIESDYGTPVLGGGNVVVMFEDSDSARKLLRYLEAPSTQEVWAARVGFISPNQRVSLSAYPNRIIRQSAEAVTEAKIFRFDASDAMPSEVGSGSFWTGVMNYVQGARSLDQVLENIEESAQEAYGD
ncbi:MAG: ABC transporter substrate-binding protein [Candidatus Bipolaricaulota bacterium]